MKIKKLRDLLFKDSLLKYDKNARPVADHTQSVVVGLGFVLTQIIDIVSTAD